MKGQMVGYNAAGRPVKVEAAKRSFHHHVIGSSGSGKSKFLEVLMRDDALSGQGFCLIDPHGTLYSDVVKFCAYRNLTREIVLFNLSDPKHIVGFNFFSRNREGDTAVQVDSRLLATLHAWGVENADQTPTLERILRLIYTSLLEADLTLPQIAVLLDFSEKEVRDKVISKIENDLIRREWRELSDLQKARDFREETLSAKNRLFRLLTSKALMRFLGVKGQSVDLLEAMNSQKIILVNLARSEHLSAENARIFGALLVNQFFEAATQRRKIGFGGDPKPFYLYLDEFQNFVSIDLCNMLDEVRKFGLFLTLSHQRFGQLGEDIEDAVLTNCRIKTVFGGLRTEDARRMAEELFIGKLDPMKIKAAIYQTKHWYKYVREKVYSKSYSRSESDSRGSGTGSGTSSGVMTATMSGQTTLPPSDDFFTGLMWLDDPVVSSLSESSTSGYSDSESSSRFESESHSTGYAESEGEADIPVFVPVPYQELSSLQYYTPEEQIIELTQALKLNQQRHCFIQLPNQETQPLLIPFVKGFYVADETISGYTQRKAELSGAITPKEADKKISQSVVDLLLLRGTATTAENAPEASPDEVNPPPSTARNKKVENKQKKSTTIFDRIKEANPDVDI
jgi:hypothetical protein